MVLDYPTWWRMTGCNLNPSNLKIKNVIMKDCRIRPVGIKDMDVISRKSENNENYMSITGTKQQINRYLQGKPVLSERLRTLNNLPKYRIINSVKVRIY